MAKSGKRLGSTIAFGILLSVAAVAAGFVALFLKSSIQVLIKNNSSETVGEAVGALFGVGMALIILMVFMILFCGIDLVIGIPALIVSSINVKKSTSKPIRIINIVYIVISSLVIIIALGSFIFLVSGGYNAVQDAMSSSSSSMELALFAL